MLGRRKFLKKRKSEKWWEMIEIVDGTGWFWWLNEFNLFKIWWEIEKSQDEQPSILVSELFVVRLTCKVCRMNFIVCTCNVNVYTLQPTESQICRYLL